MTECEICDGEGILEIAHSNGSPGWTICACHREHQDDDEQEPDSMPMHELETVTGYWQ